MIHRKKKTTRKRVSKKKKSGFAGMIRFSALLLLLLVLAFSVGTVGYVIFFRTVYAQQKIPSIERVIVFEKPKLPMKMEPLEKVKCGHELDFPKWLVFVDTYTPLGGTKLSPGFLPGYRG